MERIRFTITVEPEVHAAFQEMAEAGGQSLSRAVGDWLRDTTAASRFVAQKMRELRLSPAMAMKELHAYQRADLAETERILSAIETGRAEGVAPTTAAEPAASVRRPEGPPSSNTGGKGRASAKGGPKS